MARRSAQPPQVCVVCQATCQSVGSAGVLPAAASQTPVWRCRRQEQQLLLLQAAPASARVGRGVAAVAAAVVGLAQAADRWTAAVAAAVLGRGAGAAMMRLCLLLLPVAVVAAEMTTGWRLPKSLLRQAGASAAAGFGRPAVAAAEDPLAPIAAAVVVAVPVPASCCFAAGGLGGVVEPVRSRR